MLRLKCFDLISRLAGVVALAIQADAAPLEINPRQTRIEVAVSCTIDSFVARLEKFQTQVDCDPAVALPTKAEVTFDFADLKTGNPDRDAAMLAWLEYSGNRTASFQLTAWKQTGTTNLALGRLTMHGVTQEVQMPVTVRRDGAAWDISGGATLDYRDFKLPKIRKALILTVNPNVKITFHLTGQLAVPK